MAVEPARVAEMDQELELDLRQLWHALWRRKWIVLGLFLFAAATAYFVTSAMTPVYEATTTVLVSEQGMGLLEAAFFERLTGTTRQTAMQRAIEVLKSRSLALRVARRAGL